jgi:formylglycine-generating enzyme required for sulfatase activity
MRQRRLAISPSVSMDIITVPAGEFAMGTDPDQERWLAEHYGDIYLDDEKPAHAVFLAEYEIGKYPVTNEQYLAFVRATGRRAPNDWEGGRPPAGKEKHPVVWVSWEDAGAFCEWASQLTGERLRLPTEAEWEKAARGADGRLWPWGNQPLDAARGSEGGAMPVGARSPGGGSPYGCADMAASVGQWVADWYGSDYYSRSPRDNPLGPPSGYSRVIRGGAMHSAHREHGGPSGRNAFLGFRCACSR